MSAPRPDSPPGEPRTHPRMVRELGLATLALIAVAVAVAALVFGLILILYDPAGTLHAVA